MYMYMYLLLLLLVNERGGASIRLEREEELGHVQDILQKAGATTNRRTARRGMLKLQGTCTIKSPCKILDHVQAPEIILKSLVSVFT